MSPVQVQILRLPPLRRASGSWITGPEVTDGATTLIEQPRGFRRLDALLIRGPEAQRESAADLYSAG